MVVVSSCHILWPYYRYSKNHIKSPNLKRFQFPSSTRRLFKDLFYVSKFCFIHSSSNFRFCSVCPCSDKIHHVPCESIYEFHKFPTLDLSPPDILPHWSVQQIFVSTPRWPCGTCSTPISWKKHHPVACGVSVKVSQWAEKKEQKSFSRGPFQIIRHGIHWLHIENRYYFLNITKTDTICWPWQES